MVGRLVAVAVGLSLLVLAACGAEAPMEHHGAAPNGSEPASPAPASEAPERISGTTVYGESVDVAIDGRDVILWFWAPW